MEKGFGYTFLISKVVMLCCPGLPGPYSTASKVLLNLDWLCDDSSTCTTLPCPVMMQLGISARGGGGRKNSIGQAVGSDLLWARGVVSLVKEFFFRHQWIPVTEHVASSFEHIANRPILRN